MGEPQIALKTQKDRWVIIPLPPQMPPDTTVWHYTTPEGMLGIIQSKTIWASSPVALNDLSEINYGIQLCRKVWEELKEDDIPNPCKEFVNGILDFDFEEELGATCFIASASSESDLLNQWAHYAKSGGYAIGLNTSTELVCKGQTGSQYRFSGNRTVIEGWYKVIYDIDSQVNAIKDLLLTLTNLTPGTPETWQEHLADWPTFQASSRLFIQALILQLKHPAFHAEREVRYISALPRQISPFIRVTSGKVIPYCELHPATGSAKGTSNSRLIKKLRLSPGASVRDEQIANRIMSINSLEDTEISVSEIPFLDPRA